MVKVIGGCQNLSIEIFDSQRMIIFEDFDTNIISGTRIFGEVDFCELTLSNFAIQLVLGDRSTLYFISLRGCIRASAFT